jgi:hypothetical protein
MLKGETMRSNALVLVLWLFAGLLACFYTFWWGEAGLGLRVLTIVLIFGAVVCAILFFAIQRYWPKLLLNSLLAVTLYVCWCGAYLLGNNSFGNAYNACVSDGESVRSALQSYYQAHQAYPASLSELNIKLPGERLLRPTLMNYSLTSLGYKLSFADLMVEFIATQSQPFQAHK